MLCGSLYRKSSWLLASYIFLPYNIIISSQTKRIYVACEMCTNQGLLDWLANSLSMTLRTMIFAALPKWQCSTMIYELLVNIVSMSFTIYSHNNTTRTIIIIYIQLISWINSYSESAVTEITVYPYVWT